MADHERIEQLRRRVQLNPASIAFAALAEEYRRAGRHEEAVETCRLGLRRHPAYLTPRVTLGRALLALGRYGEARAELEGVLRVAPDHPAARLALAEVESRPTAEPSSNTPARAAADGRPSAGHAALCALEAFLAAIRRVQADSSDATRPVSR